jgi:hypothetical protein
VRLDDLQRLKDANQQTDSDFSLRHTANSRR